MIEARDVDNIYAVPRPIIERAWIAKCSQPSGSSNEPEPDLDRWQLINERIRNPEGDVTIAIVGKYTGLKDAYKSLIEALSHGGIANKVSVNLDWIESEVFEREDPTPFLEHVNGILVPGGFGERGTEGKIRAAQFARERHVPISASASECRWRSSKRRATSAASRTPTRPSSVPPPNRWSA